MVTNGGALLRSARVKNILCRPLRRDAYDDPGSTPLEIDNAEVVKVINGGQFQCTESRKGGTVRHVSATTTTTTTILRLLLLLLAHTCLTVLPFLDSVH